MHTKNGQLHLTKTDIKEIETALTHCEEDLSNGGCGTFNIGDNENTFNAKEAEKAKKGIANIRWIIQNANF